MKRTLIAAALPVSLAFAGAASAAPFPSYDPVGMATGGAGVALSRPSTGTLYNPAALSAMPEDANFDANLAVGARVFDPDDLFDEIDDFQDADYVLRVDNLTATLENFDSGTVDDAEDDLRALANAIRDLNNGLERVSDRPLQAEVGASLGLNRPSRSLGVGVSTNTFMALSAVAQYEDDTLLTQVADEIDRCIDDVNDGNNCDAGYEHILVEPNNAEFRFDTDDDLESRVAIRGLLMEEIGVSLSRRFDIAGYDVAIGITPKTQRVETFDYEEGVDDADDDDFDANDHTKSYSDMNVDVGAIVPVAERWTVGLTVRNLISRGYDTVLGNEIEIGPQARLGVATEQGWYRVAVDADLTENDPVGFEDGTQFIGGGVEFDTLSWMQLRFGYRAELENSNRNTTSAGIGLLLARTLRIDLGVAGNDNEVGAAFQIGLTF